MSKKFTAAEWVDECRGAYARWLRADLDPLCPVLIGQAGANRAGSRHGTVMFPNPRTTAGYRLFKMTGYSLDEYVSGFERFNTLGHFPGQSGRGHKFPPKEAAEAAYGHIEERRLLERPCIIVGKANAKAYYGKNDLPEPLVWTPMGAENWVWFPHTSGIVQFWNQPGNPEKLRSVFDDLRSYVPGDN